jgi:hypothetical protein
MSNPTPLLHAELTYAIRGGLFDVGNHLGAQWPEAHFQQLANFYGERVVVTPVRLGEKPARSPMEK